MAVSINKIFRDVPKLISRSCKKRLSLAEGMSQWIDYRERQYPSKTWTRFRSLDYEADFDRLTLWVTELLMNEPPAKDINGLYFGLYNPCGADGNPSSQLYLSGSTRFPKPDWHCSPEYFPDGRYGTSAILPEIYQRCEKLKDDASYLGEPVLGQGYLSLVVARWCRGPLRVRLRGNARKRSVALGHDSGDVYVVDEIKE